MMLPLLETILSEFGKHAPRGTGHADRLAARPDIPDSFQAPSPRIVQISARP